MYSFAHRAAVFELVRRARRRLLINAALREGVHALTAGLAGVVLLLVLGTQILDWYWLLLLPLTTLGIGAWRTWKSLPAPYRVGQIVDHRLELNDAVSTSVYFADPTCATKVSEGFCIQQAEHAERVCRGASAKQAVPFTVPRAVYAMGLLGLIASSLFALRYGVDRRMDLRAPLARVIRHALGLPEPQQRPQEARKQQHKLPPELEKLAALSIPEPDAGNPGELDAAPDSVLETTGVPEVNIKDSGRPSPKGERGDKKGDGQGEGESGEFEGLSTGESDSTEGKQGQGKGAKPGEQPGNQGAQSNENSGLLAKFKEAMQNLLSRMKQQPQANDGNQGQQAQSQTGKQGQTPAREGQKSGQGQQADGQQGDGQEGEPGQQGQMAQNAAGKSAGQSGDQPAPKQPGSGIGRQDGAKDLKEAEQLAAMGKISEIIGKRAANVTGEVTIEVQHSNQQLQTPYSQRAARHSEAGGEISRDEVPVALQAYVQQYFEQVRKAAPARK